MAVAATVTQLSPSRGEIKLVQDAVNPGDGVVTSHTISNADLLAAFAAGTPLGDLVRERAIGTGFARAIMLGSDVPSQHGCGRIFYMGQSAGALSLPPSINPDVSANAIVLVVETVAGAGTWTYYIDAVHSVVR